MMPKRQTSSRISTLAAKVLKGYQPTREEVEQMAASLLAQDETKGQADAGQPPRSLHPKA